jgi:hypothetical protein
MKDKTKALLLSPFGLVFSLAAPATFVLLSIRTWQSSVPLSAKLFLWLLIDPMLSIIWPIVWVYWLIVAVLPFGEATPSTTQPAAHGPAPAQDNIPTITEAEFRAAWRAEGVTEAQLDRLIRDGIAPTKKTSSVEEWPWVQDQVWLIHRGLPIDEEFGRFAYVSQPDCERARKQMMNLPGEAVCVSLHRPSAAPGGQRR